MLQDGVYYNIVSDKIIVMRRVRNYEDAHSRFAIVIWEDAPGEVNSVMVHLYEHFIFLGKL